MKNFKRLLCLILVAIMLIPSWTPVHAENKEVSLNFEYEGYMPGIGYQWYDAQFIRDEELTVFDGIWGKNDYTFTTDDKGVLRKATYMVESNTKPLKRPYFYLYQLEGVQTKITVTIGGESKELTSIPESSNNRVNLEEDFKVGDIPLKLSVSSNKTNIDNIYLIEIKTQEDFDYTDKKDINYKIVSTVKDFTKFKKYHLANIDRHTKYNSRDAIILDQEQKEGYEKIRKAFEDAKTLEDIYQARIDLQKFINEDKKRIDDKVQPLIERVNDKLYKHDENFNYLIDQTLAQNLSDEIGKFDYLPTEENKTWKKYKERILAVEEKADIELKKAELKKKLDTKVGGEDVFTPDQKEDMKAQIDGVTTYDQAAKDKLTSIEKEIDAKIKAKELKEAKDEAIKQIEDLKNLTPAEKETYKKEVQDATTREAINEAVADAKAKDAENLKTAKDEATKEIEDLKNLTPAEKETYKKEVQDATDKAGVDKAVADAKAQDQKNKDQKDLDKAKEDAKTEIGNLPNLSEDEKKEAKDKVDKAQTKEEVKKAVDEAKAKDAEKGKTPTEEEKKEAKDIIDKLPNLSEDEKKEAKDKVDKAQTKEDVKKAVDEAKAKDAEKGKTPTEEEKKEAKDIIDQLPNLSEDEKKEAKDKVDKAQTKEDVKKAVDEAKTKDAEKGKAPTPVPTPVPPIDFNRFYFAQSYQKPTEVKKTSKYTVETIIKIGSNKITRVVNGVPAEEIEMDVAAFIDNDRTYLPLRFVGESMGFKVTWDEANRVAILKNKDKEVKIAVDSNVFYVNGERFESDVKPMIKNSRTMIPVGNFARAIGLQDGKDIFWDGVSREVTIKQVMEY